MKKRAFLIAFLSIFALTSCDLLDNLNLNSPRKRSSKDDESEIVETTSRNNDFSSIKSSSSTSFNSDSSTAPHDHDFAEWNIVKEPSCDMYGIKERYCRICGFSEQGDIPPLGHLYENEISVVAEYGAAQARLVRCSRCLEKGALRWFANEYDAELTVGNVQNRTANDGTNGIRFDAVQYVNESEDPGTHIFYKIYSPISAKDLGLSFYIQTNAQNGGIPLFNNNPDDQQKGYERDESGNLVLAEKRYGLRVNDVQISLGEDLTHDALPNTMDWFDWPVSFDINQGYNTIEIYGLGGYRVIMCEFQITGFSGQLFTAQTQHTHSFANWVIVQSSTCTNDGYRERKCSVCGFVERQTIEATGHSFGEWEIKVAPTCSEAGYQESVCLRCGETQRITISPTGHDYGEWETINSPTYTTAGLEQRICRNCQNIEAREIPVIPHTVSFDTDGGTSVEQKDVYHGNKIGDVTAPTKDCYLFDCWLYNNEPVSLSDFIVNDNITLVARWKSPLVIENGYIVDWDKSVRSVVITQDILGLNLRDGIIYFDVDDIYYYGTLESWLAFEGKQQNFFAHVHLFLDGSETEATKITFPEGTKNIPGYALFNCKSIVSVHLPDGVETIAGRAFYYCDALAEINLPEGITEIGSEAFQGDESLQTIVIPSTLKCLRMSVFLYCTSLSGITIPNGVERIEDQALGRCSSLKNIHIPASVNYISGYAFTECSSLVSFTVDSGNQHYTAVDGVLYSKDLTTLIRFPSAKAETFSIPNHVTVIEAGAFMDTVITAVDIPFGITKIGDNAFTHCYYLTSLSIPNSVTYIGGGAFNQCTSIDEIVIPDSVTYLGESVFMNSHVKTIKIPSGIDSILSFFSAYNGSLVTVIIPTSVKSIGVRAFDGCSAIKRILYEGTESEWNEVVLEEKAFIERLLNKYLYFYSEEEPINEGNYWHYVNGEPTLW